MKKLTSTLLSSSLLFCASAFASQVACPNGLNYVNLGVSQKTFIATCGKPAKTESTADKNAIGGYYVWRFTPKSVYNQHNSFSHFQSSTQVLVVVHNNKVGAMRYLSDNSQGQNQLLSTLHCRNGSVSVGDDTTHLTQACGQPVSKEQLSHLPGHPQKKLPQATILQYKPANMPTVSYAFVNGKLVGKK